CSPRVHAIAGLPPDTPISRAAWLALVLPEDASLLIEHARKALEPAGDELASGGHATNGGEEHGSVDVEYRLRRASDAAVRWVALTGRVTCADGDTMRPVRATGTLRDVTRRRESVERLRNSEERFRLAADALDGLIYDYDPVADYVERSRGLQEITG